MIAGGVFMWFEESEIKQFFSMLADNFPDGEIVFNALLNSEDGFEAWIDMFPPEQRGAMRAAWAEALKDWWDKAPQDQKDKLKDVIAALKTPTKPKGERWPDLEAWWNQISDKEQEWVVRDFMTAFREGRRWTLEDANEITKWDSRITVIDQFPIFKSIPRDSLSADTRRLMDYSDERGKSRIFHLRV
jgi:hypothetical protein